MIQREKLLAQLAEKKDRFAAFDTGFRDEARGYDEALARLSAMAGDEIAARLAGDATPGALPTPEFDRARNFRLPFSRAFTHHGEARDWALATLLDHATFAVDGSQIPPTRDFNIPVAAIQAAWFENRHTRDAAYAKETAFEILAPDELLVEYDGDRQISEQMVNLRRFELEIATMCRLMRQAAERADARLPLALFDSSLVISFADRLQGEMRARHLEAILALLRCAEETGVPLIGYVDASDARDLSKMLERCFGLDKAERIHDAQLVNGRLGWGDRTPALICARRGADQKRASILEEIERDGHRIGFVYLKTSTSSPPARLDFPMWMYERGLLDEALDLVRAEVIVGNGYPYAIEAADAAAVITARDRQAFFGIFQRFVEEQGIQLRISQKAASKQRRR
jgi:hypothetical protein